MSMNNTTGSRMMLDELLLEAHRQGVNARFAGETLVITGPKPTADLRIDLSQHAAGLTRCSVHGCANAAVPAYPQPAYCPACSVLGWRECQGCGARARGRPGRLQQCGCGASDRWVDACLNCGRAAVPGRTACLACAEAG
jgi:hypothetical protein